MKRVALLSLITASFVSCGSICDRFEAATNSIDTKVKTCSDYVAGAKVSTFNKSTCEASVSKCTADDTKKLTDYAACLESVPTCSGTTAEWTLGTLLPCVGKLTGITAACNDGVK